MTDETVAKAIRWLDALDLLESSRFRGSSGSGPPEHHPSPVSPIGVNNRQSARREIQSSCCPDQLLFALVVYEYWPEWRWREVFSRLGLRVEAWSSRVHPYPPPLDWIFGRSLHFVAQLAPARAGQAPPGRPAMGSAGDPC